MDFVVDLLENVQYLLTSRCLHSSANSRTNLVPLVFIIMALLTVSSNLVVAAEWKMKSTSFLSVSLSSVVMPRSNSVTSPQMGTHFLIASGLCSFNKLNNYRNFGNEKDFKSSHVAVLMKREDLRNRSSLLTTLLKMSCSLSFGLLPFFLLMRKYIFLTSVTLRSFSTRTFPMNPVAPVTKTVLSRKISDILSGRSAILE